MGSAERKAAAKRRLRDLAAEARIARSKAQNSNVIPFRARRASKTDAMLYDAALVNQKNSRYPPWR